MLFGQLPVQNIIVQPKMYTRDEMKKAFFAGWNASGIGLNAETCEDDPIVHDMLLMAFDKKFPEDDNA